MVEINQAYRDLKNAVQPLYGVSESAQIANLVIEHITGLGRADRLMHGADLLSPDAQARLERCQQELLRWRPVQYVLGEAWFKGMRFLVDERVLIPRPETEELVDWIIDDVARRLPNVGLGHSDQDFSTGVPSSEQNIRSPQFAILDIGTGSGCIPIALKKQLPFTEVWTVDKSGDALTLARQNATAWDANLHFMEMDILDRAQWERLPKFDVIVSNPPYVPQSDSTSMRPNVRDHEPHMALFVPDADPLIFYRAIAELGLARLRAGGELFFEIHVAGWAPVRGLLSSMGYREIVLRKDLGGMDRMVSATRP